MLLAVLTLAACDLTPAEAVAAPPDASVPTTSANAAIQADAEVPADPFAAFLDAPFVVADGFSSPVGSGWTTCEPPVGLTDGETTACWEHSGPAPVRAIASGRVRLATRGDSPAGSPAGSLVTEHLWYEDQVKHTAEVSWEGLTSAVAAGDEIRRGQDLGSAQRLVLRLKQTRQETVPTETHRGRELSAFIAARPRLPVPQDEPVLALISKELRAVRLYLDGQPASASPAPLQVGFGQAQGDKQRRGDNHTPSGIYHVVAKSRGPFGGDYAAYYGGYWIKLDYPNPWDAARGVDAGLIDPATQAAITTAWWSRQGTPQKTALGGGIGMHGWAYEWEDTGNRGMSWGCVVMHLRDAPTIYETLTQGATVVIF